MTILDQESKLISKRTQGEEDMSRYFDYELTAFLTSLFKDNFMHKAAKAQSLTDSVNVSEASKYVRDGGALLHKEEDDLPRYCQTVCLSCTWKIWKELHCF